MGQRGTRNIRVLATQSTKDVPTAVPDTRAGVVPTSYDLRWLVNKTKIKDQIYNNIDTFYIPVWCTGNMVTVTHGNTCEYQ